MISLILADLYKESRRKSFKVFVLLIIFVSILSLIFINKNLSVESLKLDSYPLYSEEEYKSVNKYGSYEQYVINYSSYQDFVNRENEKLSMVTNSKARELISHYKTFLYVAGIVVIFVAFHDFSYDYQSNSIRYVFMSKRGRESILFSKIISVILMSFFYLFLLFLTYMCMVLVLSNENLFILESVVEFFGKLKVVPIILVCLVETFVFMVPMIFISLLTMFFTIWFKGSNFALIIGNVVYFCSLLFSQILITYGYNFVKYTFLPYVDFTYFNNQITVQFNNLIYNLDLSISNAVLCLAIFSIFFVFGMVKLIKRDV